MACRNLPNEVILHIIKFATIGPQTLDLQTLKNIRLCCHRLDELAQPIFYSTFKVRELDSQSLRKLLLGILQDSRVAKYLENLEIRTQLWQAYDRPNVTPLPMPYSPLLDGLAAIHGPDTSPIQLPPALSKAVRIGDREGMITLALLALPALRRLKIIVRDPTYHAYVDQPAEILDCHKLPIWLFNRAAALQSGSEKYASSVGSLRRLESLTLTAVQPLQFPISYIIAIISIVSLQNFTWQGVNIFWDVPATTRFSNVRHLSLTDFRVPTSFVEAVESVSKLLSLFTAVEVLKIEWSYIMKWASQIKHVRHCLRYFSTQTPKRMTPFVYKPAQTDSYEGLDKLQTLIVPATTTNGRVSDLVKDDEDLAAHEAQLMPSEVVIPISIQYLTVTFCDQRFLEQFIALLRSDWLSQSMLRRVELRCLSEHKKWIDETMEEWKQICEVANVELTIDFAHYWQPSNDGMISFFT